MYRLLISISAFIWVYFVLNLNGYAQSLCINEIQVANVDQFIDPSYNYGGWVELYNPTTNIVSLNGFRLRHTDNEGEVEQEVLTSSHGNVPAKGFAVLWFDHNSKDGYYGSYAETQIPFKLDADGGKIELLNPNDSIIDAVEYPQCIARSSWMRETDGASNFVWTAQATPQVSNRTSCPATERLKAPVVSSTGGVFDGSYHFTVEIPENCTLHYTIDGSTPEPGKSLVSYDGVFEGDSLTIYRFMLSRPGHLNSPVVTRSCFMSDVDYTLPILSVNTAPKNFFDDTIGVYVTGTNGRVDNNSKGKANQNMDWERPVNVEYFVPNEDKTYIEAINQEANFATFGGWTRFNAGNENFDYMTSFKLKSDKVFEFMNSFSYPLFESKPHIKLKNFLVRNGGDCRGRLWDATIHEMLRTSGVYIDCQAWQPTHVYLDGKYLGLLNLREESNRQFAFSNYGIDTDEIDQWEGDIIIKAGDKQMLDYWYDLSEDLANNPSDTSIWNKICDIVDIDEYCNYMAAEIYSGNDDWLRGGFKNLKGFRAKDGNGKFHLVLHDVDASFGRTDMILQVLSKGTGSLPIRFKNMLKYEPFKKQFIDAYCIMNGSVFDPDRCVPIINAIRDINNQALALEGLSADMKADRLVSRISDNVERRPALKKSLKSAFSLDEEYTITLQSNIPNAKLLLNGQEIPTGRFDGYLFPPIKLTSLAPNGYLFKEWTVNGEAVSADSILYLSEEFGPDTYHIEAVYQKSEIAVPHILINEISAGNDIFVNDYWKKADWIELYNNSDQDYDLTGLYLSDNPDNTHKYQIPQNENVNTIIPAFGYKVIWCDGKESETQIHASFKLKNEDGAFISITDASGAWMDSLYYREQPRWFTFGRYPDGGNNLAMFDRPTIENSNRVSTSTLILGQKDRADSLDAVETDRKIVAIRYYNINGQLIFKPENESIVIKQIIYSDGSQVSMKIIY